MNPLQYALLVVGLLVLALIISMLARRFSRPGILNSLGGLQADKSADFGAIAAWANGNMYCGASATIVTAGTNSTLSAIQVVLRFLRLTTGASGGFTITLPTTSALISAYGPTIPTDGTYGQILSILNDGTGQTGTLTAGDVSTTITGTATLATNTRRDFFVTITSPTTVTVQNMGSAAI